MDFVCRAAESIALALRGFTIIVDKSTVPVGAGDLVTRLVSRANPAAEFAVVANPEFLREGNAIDDFMHPDRVVLGSADRAAAMKVAELYRPILALAWDADPAAEPPDCIVLADLHSAEMIKYASNAFLATRISFINEIAGICDRLGADVKLVARGMGKDRRIGPAFLDAGLGYGGSCFPKDVRALDYMASMQGLQPRILRAVMDVNQDQRRLAVKQLRDIYGVLDGRTISLFGLSFKPNTDDLREAPAVEIIQLLQYERAIIRAYDPVAANRARSLLHGVTICNDPYAAASGADAVLICTEWPEFSQLDFGRLREVMARPVLIDGRNLFEPELAERHGFLYRGIGRGHFAARQALAT